MKHWHIITERLQIFGYKVQEGLGLIKYLLSDGLIVLQAAETMETEASSPIDYSEMHYICNDDNSLTHVQFFAHRNLIFHVVIFKLVTKRAS